MKQSIKIFLILLTVCICVCSCDVDPYVNQRPLDYENSLWVCEGEGFKMYYKIGETIEGELSFEGEEPQKIDFLWSAFSSDVNIYVLSDNDEPTPPILVGECKFSRKKFVMNVTYKSGCGEKLPDTLIFNRVS